MSKLYEYLRLVILCKALMKTRKMKKNKLIAPFLKWVGGKRQLMSSINQLLPKKYSAYYEPFLGGGAVLFEIQPKKAVINDSNTELINTYKIIKYSPEELIQELKRISMNRNIFTI